MFSTKMILSFALVAFLQGCSTQQAGERTERTYSLRGTAGAKAAQAAARAQKQDPETAELIEKIHVQREKIHRALSLIDGLQAVEAIGAEHQHDMDVKLQQFKENQKMHDDWFALFNEELNDSRLNMDELKGEIAQLYSEVTISTKELTTEAKAIRERQVARIAQAEKLSEAMTLVGAMNNEKFEEFKADGEMSKVWSHLFGKDLESEDLTLAQMKQKVQVFIANEQHNHDTIQKSCHMLAGGMEL